MENTVNDGKGLRVKIFKQNECIYEDEFKSQSNPASDLKNLIANMKDAQLKVNTFLTDLIEKDEGTASLTTTAADSDDDDDSEDTEEDMVTSKKCKLTN